MRLPYPSRFKNLGGSKEMKTEAVKQICNKMSLSKLLRTGVYLNAHDVTKKPGNMPGEHHH